MSRDAQMQEIARNYDAFQRRLSEYLPQHRDEYALLKAGEVQGFYPTPGEADREGWHRFADRLYSIQQVTSEPIDLGCYANAVHPLAS